MKSFLPFLLLLLLLAGCVAPALKLAQQAGPPALPAVSAARSVPAGMVRTNVPVVPHQWGIVFTNTTCTGFVLTHADVACGPYSNRVCVTDANAMDTNAINALVSSGEPGFWGIKIIP